MRLTSFLFLLLACFHPISAEEFVVDGSTRETYERSIKEMADSFPEKERELFVRGLLDLIFTRYPPVQGAKGLLITYEAHVRTCALARDPIQAASMASCNSFGQCWATVTCSRRRKTLG